jgi:hypothetical protein
VKQAVNIILEKGKVIKKPKLGFHLHLKSSYKRIVNEDNIFIA